HHLVDRALVAVDGLHHQLEHGIEDLARLLGIAVGQEFYRALQVGEERRDLLALTLERAFGRENPLGEMLWGVAPRRRKAWLPTGGGLLAELGSAAVAESTSERVDLMAGRTCQLKARAAAVAEAGAGWIVLLAFRAAHQPSPFNSASACSR